jgi:aminopeptidase YwaD
MDTALESEVMGHVHKLSVEIGPRVMGTPEDHAAADYVRQVFERAGLVLDEHRWECPYWTAGETTLEISGERFEAYANTFSPSCDVTAPTLAVGTIAELEQAELQGKIGILYGELAASPLTCMNYIVYNPERDLHINRVLQAKQPAALITLEPSSRVYEPLIQDRDLGIASASVRYEVGLEVVQRAGESAHLVVITQSVPSSSANIIGRRGKGDSPRMVLCAHYDTKLGTPGAVDNGAGAAALLALANRVHSLPDSVNLELVAFGGEEYYASGDVEYARRNEGHFHEVLAAINMDGVGQRLGANTITMMSYGEAFHALVEEIVKVRPSIAWTEPWPASNHYTFYSRGVPSIALSSAGVYTIHHRPADTIEWVSPTKLAEVVPLVLEIVTRLQDKPLEWTRKAAHSL